MKFFILVSKKVLNLLPNGLIKDSIWKFFCTTHVPFSWSVQGMKIAGLSLIHYVKGVYEPEPTEFYKKLIKPGWTILDIGADVGYFSVLFAKLTTSSGIVYAMEPYSWRYFNYLLSNIIKNKSGNIIPIMFGASSIPTVKKFYGDCRSTYDIYKRGENVEEIRCLPVDQLLGDIKIDLIKMDIEGGELDALIGMSRILDNNKSICLVLECNPRVFDKIGLKIEDMFTLLKKHGFHFYEIKLDGSIQKKTDKEIIEIARKNKYINFFCSR